MAPPFVRGRRAIIEFTPSLTSLERYCAGVVLMLQDGTVHTRTAVDQAKAEHAFGQAGRALWEACHHLCQAFAAHWGQYPSGADWQPPFAGARLASEGPFSARSLDSAFHHALASHSGLNTLLSAYNVSTSPKTYSIVARVRRVVSRDTRTEHLAKRFERMLQLGQQENDLHLRVDFLGQHFACYFLEPPSTDKLIDSTAERALGKLYELQTMQRFMREERITDGLLPDERPKHFELLVVADPLNLAQQRVFRQIEGLADKNQARARQIATADEAAAHVVRMERAA